MRRLTVVLLLVALSGCVASGPGTRSSIKVLAQLPATIAPATRMAPPERDPSPTTVEGAWVRYQMPFGRASIYLFREAGPLVPPGPDSPQVQQHHRAAMQTMAFVGLMSAAGQPAVAGQSNVVAFREQPGFEIRPLRGPAFRCGHLLRVQGNTPPLQHQSELVCVTGALDRLLKLRVTVRQPSEDSNAVRGFLAGLAGQVAASVAAEGEAPQLPKPSSAPPPADDAVPDAN